MTKRFRLGLFMALAAAVGLHLRPCLGCLVAASIETVASGVSSGAHALDGQGTDLVRAAGQASSGSDSLVQAPLALGSSVSGQRPRRPSMTAMAVGPVRLASGSVPVTQSGFATSRMAKPGPQVQPASFVPASSQRALVRDAGIAR